MLKLLTRLRNYLISGLLFWIPLILTIIVIKFFLEFINSLVPQEYLPEAIFNLDTSIPGSGIILLFLIILITGILVTNILGRRLVNTSSQSFKKAFLIQYPSKGIWVIAFQSGDYRGEAESILGEETINLFVPTTPNPTSGFFVLIPKKDAFELDISVEDAFKLVISAGVVTPNSVKIKGKK